MDEVGEINFVDVSVNRSTDAILVRATLPNPDSTLIDGQLVQVILDSGSAEERVLVPQAALIADQAGTMFSWSRTARPSSNASRPVPVSRRMSSWIRA